MRIFATLWISPISPKFWGTISRKTHIRWRWLFSHELLDWLQSLIIFIAKPEMVRRHFLPLLIELVWNDSPVEFMKSVPETNSINYSFTKGMNLQINILSQYVTTWRRDQTFFQAACSDAFFASKLGMVWFSHTVGTPNQCIITCIGVLTGSIFPDNTVFIPTSMENSWKFA